ncbi:hypothetical protein FXV77_21165 [Sphingobacterium phlebotomi]|uniref:Uncharacterized protein n=1 Tax=Sphingobacterium phlebotomi TaxID=2605433 RepID=A0A5D4GR13_9SPHI|nr:hypothetical protein [Sphingobacterium phlebotomi]TYR31261.1 hypothetical protein FXV77_21165 [Sphingobacterium phlebotomi]
MELPWIEQLYKFILMGPTGKNDAYRRLGKRRCKDGLPCVLQDNGGDRIYRMRKTYFRTCRDGAFKQYDNVHDYTIVPNQYLNVCKQ